MSERLVAVLDGRFVSNVVVVDADWDGGSDIYVEYTDGCPAAIGWEYDGVGFIPPKPFPSWVLDDYVWVAPVPKPEGAVDCYWDEDQGIWVS